MKIIFSFSIDKMKIMWYNIITVKDKEKSLKPDWRVFMKKLMRVRTNVNNMLVTYDNKEKIVRILPDSCKININYIDLKYVEDDSNWDIFEDVENIKDLIGSESEIIEEIEVDF